MTTLTEDKLLTEAQTAEILQFKPQTLSVWRSRGSHDLPFIHVGRHVRYRLSDIEKWLSDHTATVVTGR